MRGSTAARIAGLSALLSASPPAAAAQTCNVDRSPDHAEWHAAYLERRPLERALETALRDEGVLPFGRVLMRRDDVTGAIELTPRGFELAPEARARLVDLVETHRRERPPREERPLWLHLGLPDTPLWPDSTVECPPALLNRDEVRDAMGRIVSQVTDPEVKRRLRGRTVRFEAWLLADETGRVDVESIERKDGPEEYWRWLEPVIQGVLAHFRFRPASMNGVPTAVWISQALTIRF